jgi:ATP synthase protein I
MANDSNHTNQDEEDRSPYSIAMEWTARISVISMEMVVPMVIGVWLDSRWRTLPLCVIIGGALGFWTALQSLLQISKQRKTGDSEEKR